MVCPRNDKLRDAATRTNDVVLYLDVAQARSSACATIEATPPAAERRSRIHRVSGAQRP